jgi:hypothetical protein
MFVHVTKSELSTDHLPIPLLVHVVIERPLYPLLICVPSENQVVFRLFLHSPSTTYLATLRRTALHSLSLYI